jgi:ABC-type sugar transport system substrate-binding protein
MAEAEGKEFVVYEIIGSLGHEGSERRSSGYHEIFDASPLITVIKSPDAQWAPDNAMQFVLDALPANPEINAVVTHNGMVSGVIEALSTLGMLYERGDPNHIPVYGIDAFPSTMELIRNGFADGVAVHSPWEEADASIKCALLYVCLGQEVPEVVMFSSFLINIDNADAVRYGAPLVWGEMMDQYPDYKDWPILDLPAEFGVPIPTVDMR